MLYTILCLLLWGFGKHTVAVAAVIIQHNFYKSDTSTTIFLLWNVIGVKGVKPDSDVHNGTTVWKHIDYKSRDSHLWWKHIVQLIWLFYQSIYAQ